MKTIAVVFLISLMCFSACKKATNTVDATVVRDCTGVYVQVSGEDYFVCNYKKLNKYSDGDMVKVEFTRISTCQSDQVVCLMLHPSVATIDVGYIEMR